MRIDFNDEKLKHLGTSGVHKIAPGSKACVIFGFNGTGKTSIYNYLKGTYPGFYFMDYDETKKDLVEKQKKSLEISPQLSHLKKLEEELGPHEKEKNRMLKDFGYTKQADTEALESDTLTEILKRDTFSGQKISLPYETSEDFFKLPSNMRNSFIKHYKQLKEVKQLKKSVQELKNRFFDEALAALRKYVDSEDKVCPVCDSKKDKNIREIIDEKRKEIAKTESELIEIFRDSKTDNKIMKEQLEKMKGFADTISSDHLFDLMVFQKEADTGNLTKEKYDDVKKDYEHYCQRYEEHKVTFEKRDEQYSMLKTAKTQLETMLKTKFGAGLEFLDKKKTAKISFGQPVSTLSHGEKNLITFLVHLYTFYASDYNMMIMDDPISSFDLPNQYIIAFEIAYLVSKQEDKSLLILTHNADLINNLHTIRRERDLFTYYNIDVMCQGDRAIQPIEIDCEKDNLLSLSSLRSYEDKEKGDKYIQALIEREHPAKEELNGLFHYKEGPYKKNEFGSELSNDKLVRIIEDFSGDVFGHGFIEMTYTKVLVLVALRVWVEKQIYDYAKGKNQLEKLQKCHGFRQIVKYARCESLLSEDEKRCLMSKKTMLNHNCHYQSQVLPFYYAMNISAEEIKEEINQVKDLFLEKVSLNSTT